MSFSITELQNANLIATHPLEGMNEKEANAYFDDVCQNMATEVILYNDSKKQLRHRPQIKENPTTVDRINAQPKAAFHLKHGPVELACMEQGEAKPAVGDLIAVRTADGWHEGWKVVQVDELGNVFTEQTMATMGQGLVRKTKSFANIVTNKFYVLTGSRAWWNEVRSNVSFVIARVQRSDITNRRVTRVWSAEGYELLLPSVKYSGNHDSVEVGKRIIVSFRNEEPSYFTCKTA